MARSGALLEVPAPTAARPSRRLASVHGISGSAALRGFLAAFVSGIVLVAGLSVGIGVVAADAVLPGVTVGGVDLAGLDRAAAEERLNSELPPLSTGVALVSVGETDESIPYSELGREYETRAMVDAALGVGRDSGNPIVDGVERLRTLVHSSSLPVLVQQYDPDALAGVSLEIASGARTWPVEAAVIRDGTTFNVRPGEGGRTLQPEAVATALAGALGSADSSDVRVEVGSTTLVPTVTTPMAEEAAAAAQAMVADLQLTVADADPAEEALALSAETIGGWISFGPEGELDYTARLDTAAVAAHVEGLAADVDQAPVNASIAVGAGGGLGGVVAGQDGRTLNIEESITSVVEALRQRADGAELASLPLVVDVTEAPFTTAEAQAQLPRMEMVSSWTTDFVPGESNGYGANITIGAFDIDGRNLAPGETFSFWDSIGPVTEARGYTYGGAIINGRSTQGIAIGGGICSTSTTIFNAALRAGLEMGIRRNHYYYIDRYPDGLDATVSIMDGWTQDMTFRNDTENMIVIRGFGNNGGSVTFELWTVPTGRQVVITDPVTSNHRAAIDTTVVDASLAPGTSKRIEDPHDGHDVTRTRYVYDANGTLLHQDTYVSKYATVNGIVAVGPSAAASAPTPPADEGAIAGSGDEAPPPATPPNG